MALLSSSLFLSASTPTKAYFVTPSAALTSFTASSSNNLSLLPPLNGFQRTSTGNLRSGRRRSWIVGMAPEEEKLTRRSPLDFPIEWERPRPAGRPNIFPQFSPMKTPLPPPMPADPTREDEEDEEEEEEREEEEEEVPKEEDPDKQEE